MKLYLKYRFQSHFKKLYWKYSRKPIIRAHDHSSPHHSNQKEEILASNEAGCFHCIKIFNPILVIWKKDYNSKHEYIGDCAYCPFCEIDSVIGSKSGFPITKEFLTAMKLYWFGISYAL